MDRPALIKHSFRCREFPSLSGAPQAQFHNPSQAVWANANQRAVQHTPVQRPQQHHPNNPQNSSQQHSSSSHDGPRQITEDLFSSNSQFQASLDDYRHGVPGGVSQASGSGQPQTGNIEDFPPLGRNGIEGNGPDRRGSLMQNAAFATFSNTNGLNLSQTTGIPGTTAPSNQSDNRAASTLADRIMSPNAMAFGGMDKITNTAVKGSNNKLHEGSSLARSPADPTRQNHPGLSDHEKNVGCAEHTKGCRELTLCSRVCPAIDSVNRTIISPFLLSTILSHCLNNLPKHKSTSQHVHSKPMGSRYPILQLLQQTALLLKCVILIALVSQAYCQLSEAITRISRALPPVKT